MKAMGLAMVTTALLAVVGCSDEPQSSKRTDASGGQSVVQKGPDGRGPRGGDYFSTVLRSTNVGKRGAALAQMQSLAKDLGLYVAQEGRYPAALSDLSQTVGSAEGLTVSVHDKKTPIVYIPPKASPDAATVVAYDPVLYPGDEMVALFGDGSARRVKVEQLEEALKAQGVQPQ